MDVMQLLQNAIDSGSVWMYGLVFLGGVLASFTPCTYPVLPLTVGFIGHRAAGQKVKAFFLSLALVIGMATVYAVLGIVFAALRKPFGALQGSGPFLFGVSIFFIGMSLFLLDVFTFSTPKFLSGFGGKGRNVPGALGAFVVGCASGLVVGPCTGPILAVVLASVTATLQDAEGLRYGLVLLDGGFKLFLFGLGQGALILACGTFSGFLSMLPKAGVWMNWFKKGFALLVLCAACLLLLYTGHVTGFDPLSDLLLTAEGVPESKAGTSNPDVSSWEEEGDSGTSSNGQSRYGGDEFLE